MIIPAIVEIVACDMPAAIARAFPFPVIAITSKTLIIPTTVPSNPSIGQIAINIFISAKDFSILIFASEIRRVLI